MLRKADKKKDRQILFGHRQSLLEQLHSCLDPALALHLAVLAIFQHITGTMLHASGKFVPLVVEQLETGGRLGLEQLAVLFTQQRLVLASLARDSEEEEQREVAAQLELSTPAVKQLVADLKKSGGTSD